MHIKHNIFLKCTIVVYGNLIYCFLLADVDKCENQVCRSSISMQWTKKNTKLIYVDRADQVLILIASYQRQNVNLLLDMENPY